MGLTGEQEFSAEIAASQLNCFETIVDFESYPQWATSIRGVRILETDRSGIGRVVEFRLDARIKTLRYVLEYAHRKPRELTWRSIGGDVKAIEGSYRFRKLAPRRTAVTCRQAIDLGFWLPGPLRSIVERSALRDSVLEFKTEVERRCARNR